MAVKQKFKHDLKLISDEASEFMGDLSNLGNKIAETGGDQIKEAKENIEDYLSSQIADLKERVRIEK